MRLDYFLQYRGRKLPLLPDPGIAFGGRGVQGDQ